MRNLAIFVFFAAISVALAGQKDVVGRWKTTDKSAILELWDDGEAGYVRGKFSGNGTWKLEKEGKFEGTIRVDLNSKNRTKFVLYFQPDGRKLLGVNTLTVDGISIPDDTLLFDPNQ